MAKWVQRDDNLDRKYTLLHMKHNFKKESTIQKESH